MLRTLKASRIMVYILVVLLLLLTMMTVMSYTVVEPALSTAGGHNDMAANFGSHNSLDYYECAVTFEDVNQLWEQRLECRLNNISYILLAVPASADTASPPNRLFMLPEEASGKVNHEIAFQHAGDGMK